MTSKPLNTAPLLIGILGWLPKTSNSYLVLPGDVWRYPGTFGVTRGRLALQGDVWRYRGTFGVTEGRLALQRDGWRYEGGLISYL